MNMRRLHKDGQATVGCPQDPKENSFPAQKGTHEANLMLASSNRSEASSVGGPSEGTGGSRVCVRYERIGVSISIFGVGR